MIYDHKMIIFGNEIGNDGEKNYVLKCYNDWWK